MKKHENTSLIWLVLAGLLFSGCAQAIQQIDPPGASPTPGSTCKSIALVIASGGNTDIYSFCPQDNSLNQLTDTPSTESDPAWSPDGKRIAFASSRSGSSQIYLMDADGGHPLQLTSDQENDRPLWLPGGGQLAFRSHDGHGLWCWRLLELETGRISQLTEASYDFFFQTPAWSPDGQKIAYMSLLEQKERNDGASQIHVKNVDGSQDLALTRDTWGNINPVWSPDGSKIAFLSERDGTYNLFALYVMSRDGTDLQKLTEPGYEESTRLAWSADGQEIALSNERGISLIDSHTGSQRKLIRLAAGQSAFSPSWQP